MLVVAYKINEVLVGNFNDNGDSCSGAILIGVTATLTIISLVWNGFQYYWYNGCGYNNVIISVTVIAGIAFFGFVLIKRTREDASILTSSIVFVYVTYL